MLTYLDSFQKIPTLNNLYSYFVFNILGWQLPIFTEVDYISIDRGIFVL